MDFESTLVMYPLGNFYQLIMVAVSMLSSITFSNQDNFLLFTVVPTSMLNVTRCFVVVSSSCTFYPESP